MENTDVFLGLHDFLERMRQPSAADLVKSIKSFVVTFSNNAPDPDRDSAAVQEFLANMEATFRAHSLWAGCSEEELDSADEGLEKYIMTKLFTRVFASLPDDVKCDEELYEKMAKFQQFVYPENLDITPTFQNETSWLPAQKELQKINMYKAPRDKLVCILNCCKAINNLLINASMASNENPPGADEFLPVLIYVTIKANPPQLHSNLLYIQRYRSQSRLVAEAAYLFTNMLSAESFISNIDAKALSMEESEFQNNLESAQTLLSSLSTDAGYFSREQPIDSKHQALNSEGKEPLIQPESSERKSGSKNVAFAKDQAPIEKVLSFSELENEGATMLLKEDKASQFFRKYPYLFANVGDLTINDVEDLLNNYKQLAFKYVCLFKGLGSASLSMISSNLHMPVGSLAENVKATDEDHKIAELNDESHKDTGTDHGSKSVLVSEEDFESHLPQDEADAHQGGRNDGTSR